MESLFRWVERRGRWRQLLPPEVLGRPWGLRLEELLDRMSQVDPDWRSKETPGRRLRRTLAWIGHFGLVKAWKTYVAEAAGDDPWIPSLSEIPDAVEDIQWAAAEHPDAVLKDFERREQAIHRGRREYCARQGLPCSKDELNDLTVLSRLDYLHRCCTASHGKFFAEQTWPMVLKYLRHDARGVLCELMTHRVLDLKPPETVRERLGQLLSSWDSLPFTEQRESDGVEYNAPTRTEWSRERALCIELWNRSNSAKSAEGQGRDLVPVTGRE